MLNNEKSYNVWQPKTITINYFSYAYYAISVNFNPSSKLNKSLLK